MQKTCRPLTFSQDAEHHVKTCNCLPWTPTQHKDIHSPNSTCTPSLGTPIIKAFEALEADQRATTRQPKYHCGLRPKQPTLPWRTPQRATILVSSGAYRTRGAEQWWGLPCLFFPACVRELGCGPRAWLAGELVLVSLNLGSWKGDCIFSGILSILDVCERFF